MGFHKELQSPTQCATIILAVVVTIIAIGSFGQNEGGFECQGEGYKFRFNVKNVCLFIHLFS